MQHRVFLTLVVLSPLWGSGVSTEPVPGADWAILRSQGLTAYDRGDFEQAERFLRSALSALPDSVSTNAVFLCNELGKALQALSRFDDAEQQYRRAI